MIGLNLGGPLLKPVEPKPQIQQSMVSFNTQQALANLMALSRLSNTGGANSLFEQPANASENNAIMTSNNLMTTTEHAQMQIRCKFGTLGEFQGQFQQPHGFCMGRDEEIVVADTYNHRIQVYLFSLYLDFYVLALVKGSRFYYTIWPVSFHYDLKKFSFTDKIMCERVLQNIFFFKIEYVQIMFQTQLCEAPCNKWSLIYVGDKFAVVA